MPKTVIDQDRNRAWNINGTDQTWTLEKGATITVLNKPAIEVNAADTGNTLELFGDIQAYGSNAKGVMVGGEDTTILVGKTSEINAIDGLYGFFDGMKVINRGEIEATFRGISSSVGVDVRNDGEIAGDMAITASGTDTRIVNNQGASIAGTSSAIRLLDGEGGEIVNRGILAGSSTAIEASSSIDTTILNTGTILGDVILGDGNDLIDTRKGKVVGDLGGGEGNDRYMVSKAGIDIVELANAGTDRVFSTVSYELGSHVENLTLMGNKDISGSGNSDDNFILGNRGDNTIAGGNGDDYLGGRRGDDVLGGGSGEDRFMFNAGDDRDTIADFDNGTDLIWMTGFADVSSFEDLEPHLSQHAGDVWISMGDGDRLVISGTTVAQLDATDFSFLVV